VLPAQALDDRADFEVAQAVHTATRRLRASYRAPLPARKPVGGVRACHAAARG
jgi:hypothetical protein